MRKVLILDSSKSMRNTLRERLEYEGFTAETAESEEVARRLLASARFDLMLTDDRIRPEADLPFIILSNENSIESAIEAVRNGAEDFLTRPIDMNRLLRSIHRTLDEPSDEATDTPPRPTTRRARRTPAPTTVEAIIGSSPEISHVRELISKVAPCEARVLITGENGTGKELVARHLHLLSPRSTAPFVEVNCAAIPSELIESELFGHERGAFTSAVKQRKGKFELADGGTLFMDEIGDMSLAAQAKVLRALQERKISRVGSDRDIDVNVRVIAATNKDLKEEIRLGNFREDLYHRIGVIVIRVPALRERISDIPMLTDHFIHRIAEEYHTEPKQIDPSALRALEERPWSGNIRELRNAVERLIILSGEKITERDVSLYC
ncbi:MAG: sigma-54-dependent Fis family transcriptional regulator [Alistipes sp.]|jgi:DNA-binding NtrC family response regulator|nr:sigma-54-dependent Fis family transcriptional regulator [Alistipes sp.]